MNSIEAEAVIKYMQNLWENWNPTDDTINLWMQEFKYHDEDVAVRAMNEAAMQTNHHRPPYKDIHRFLRQYKPKVTILNKPRDEPTVFVMYHGDGHSRLLEGHFIPIIPAGGCDVMQAAERTKGILMDTHGGMWKVYEQTDHRAMIKMRNELRAEIVNA